ncbi:MAG: ABC transporter substrate-binding protein [Dehalococcoidia bacterium]|nr:ABC transporter substrate-binding protein [Dehalococcoidia bacterium]
MQLRRRQFLNLTGMSLFGFIMNACSNNRSLNSLSNEQQLFLNKFDSPDIISRASSYVIGLYSISDQLLMDNYIFPLTYSTLLDFDITDGKLYSDIAKNLEIINSKNFLFTIREDIFFHPDENGFAEPLTAEDIKNDFNKRIKNKEPFFYNVIKSLEIVNNKLLISLKNPFPYFIEFISNSSVAGIRHSKVYEKGSLFRGSGPYIPVQVNKNDYTLVANTFYHEDRLPLLNFIYIKKYFDISIMKKDFSDNSFDLILSNQFVNSLNSIALSQIKLKNPSKEIIIFALSMAQNKGGTDVKYIEAFQNPKVRKAISKSINRNLLIEEFDGFITGTVPPSFPLDALNESEINQIDFMIYDPIEAKQLLLDSGFSGLEFRIDLPNTVFFSTLGVLLAKQLSKVGFEPRLVFSDVDKLKNSLELGDFEAVLYTQKFDISPDVGLMMNTSLGINNQYSKTGFSSPLYDYEIEKSFYEYDPIKRGELAKKAQKNLFEQSPAEVPLFCTADIGLSNKLISGFQFEKLSSNFKIFSKYWVKDVSS